MNRKIIYPGQIPLETDLLGAQKNSYLGLAKLAEAIIGKDSTKVSGLTCGPTTPASMQVSVSAGQIFALELLDSTAYSSIAADAVNYILKQGIALDATLLNCPAPGTVGYSINYLVQAAFETEDSDDVVLPYYNSANPSVSYSGPAGSGTAQSTTREDNCVVTVKAGTAATTGSQVTPAPDTDNHGLWVVTVAYGQTTITATDITRYSAAPALIPMCAGNLIFFASATGASNAYSVTLSSSVDQFITGMTIAFIANHTNTGAATLNVNGLGAKSIKTNVSTAMSSGDIANGQVIMVTYDGTNFQLNQWKISAASQSEMEAASETAKFVTPAVAKHHPGVAKAWVSFNGVGTVAINASHNISGLTDVSTGRYYVDFTTAFSSAYYAVGACAYHSGAAGLVHADPNSAPTASRFYIATYSYDTNMHDYTNVMLTFHGDQ